MDSCRVLHILQFIMNGVILTLIILALRKTKEEEKE